MVPFAEMCEDLEKCRWGHINFEITDGSLVIFLKIVLFCFNFHIHMATPIFFLIIILGYVFIEF